MIVRDPPKITSSSIRVFVKYDLYVLPRINFKYSRCPFNVDAMDFYKLFFSKTGPLRIGMFIRI